MAVKIGKVELGGSEISLPRSRSKAKQVLKRIAKTCGVDKVYFVRTKHASHGGWYRHTDSTIVVVEQEGKCQVPMRVVVFRFFHELTHHLHIEGEIFLALYYQEVKLDDGTKRKYTQRDRRRIALRAEQHANQKACELAYEFFGLELEPPHYPKEFLKKMRGDIFG